MNASNFLGRESNYMGNNSFFESFILFIVEPRNLPYKQQLFAKLTQTSNCYEILIWRMCRGRCLPEFSFKMQCPTSCVSSGGMHADLAHICFECPFTI